MSLDLVKFLSDAGVAVIQVVVGAVAAWVIGTRVAYAWDDHKRRRESDLAALTEFYRAYGRFYTTWSLWNTHKNAGGTYQVTWPEDTQSELLTRAEEAEAAFETTLMKLASERVLDPSQLALLRAFRQGYQSLRERIRIDEPLEWWATPRARRMSGYRRYRAFKALGEYVAYLLVSSPPRPWAPWARSTRPDDKQSIEALLAITQRDEAWSATAERELGLPDVTGG